MIPIKLKDGETDLKTKKEIDKTSVSLIVVYEPSILGHIESPNRLQHNALRRITYRGIMNKYEET